jgi:RNA polymerase sigma-70 factor, ECF subfamily
MSTDAELIAQVLMDDDRQAFEALVQKHQSRLRSFFRKMCGGDEMLADDLSQETFLKAYRGMQSYQGQSQFITWLFAIAKNVFYEHIRRSEAFTDLPDDVEAGAETGQDLKMDMARCMLKLEPQERMILTLSYMDGLSQTEVAELMNIPLGTVKTHSLRAKEKLKTLLTR